MTVCIATLFTWQYSDTDHELAALTTSDRMITAGDIEYEPPQFKTCFLTRRVHALVAGDFAVHSEALTHVQRQLALSPESDVGLIASMYADALADIKFREAARSILRPASLTPETFISRQRELAADQIAMLTQQLQGWRGPETEALIVGADDVRAHIWLIDSSGALSCQNDIGFAAIGLGAWHAKSQFMLAGWAKQISFAGALAVSFLAKKSAEIAPGVGNATDMFLITREGGQSLIPAIREDLDEAHKEYADGNRRLAQAAVAKIQAGLFKRHQEAIASPQPNLEQAAETQSDPKCPSENKLSYQNRLVTGG